jgi:hypothetical protein
MRAFILVLLIASFPVASAESFKTFGEWRVNEETAATFNGDFAFGEFCHSETKSCTWKVVINIECNSGDGYSILTNTAVLSSIEKITCQGKAPDYSEWFYSFNNWKTLESVIKSPGAKEIAFAFPVGNSQIRVVRFSLDGMQHATNILEKRFFKTSSRLANDVTL